MRLALPRVAKGVTARRYGNRPHQHKRNEEVDQVNVESFGPAGRHQGSGHDAELECWSVEGNGREQAGCDPNGDHSFAGELLRAVRLVIERITDNRQAIQAGKQQRVDRYGQEHCCPVADKCQVAFVEDLIETRVRDVRDGGMIAWHRGGLFYAMLLQRDNAQRVAECRKDHQSNHGISEPERELVDALTVSQRFVATEDRHDADVRRRGDHGDHSDEDDCRDEGAAASAKE